MQNSGGSALLPPKPRGLRKWVYALPRYLYALHLGWLFDHKFLSQAFFDRCPGAH